MGFAVFWWVMDQAELANLAVENGYRGRGIGGALLDRVLAEAAAVGAGTIFLEVRVSNDDARRITSYNVCYTKLLRISVSESRGI